MGKVSGKMWSKGNLGGLGPPQLAKGLGSLTGWSREKLRAVFQEFRRQQGHTVDLEDFIRISGLERDVGEAAFKELKPNAKGRIDFLTIFAPMVATSDQCYISRVSFLFSVFDLDSSGAVNRAEFFIATRGLFVGLSRFFETAMIPGPKELEEVTVSVFDRIDEDKGGHISLGELLAFAYRSREFKGLLEPFPAADQRVFEDLLVFPREHVEMEKEDEQLLQNVEEKLSFKLQITPDPRQGRSGLSLRKKEKVRPMNNRGMGKAHAFFMYKVFSALSTGQPYIESIDFKGFLGDRAKVTSLVDAAAKEAAEVTRPRDGEEAKGSGEDIGRLRAHVASYLTDVNAISRLTEMTDGKVSLRAFFCLSLFSTTEVEIESCLRWCRLFRAQGVMHELAKREDQLHLDKEDIAALFAAMDVDGNGRLTADELAVQGNLSDSEIDTIMSRWDTDRSGELSKKEMEALLIRMDASLKSDLRGAFATQGKFQGNKGLSFSDGLFKPKS